MCAFETLIYEKNDRIAWIILNRPDKLNALSRKSWVEFIEALEKAEEDDVGVIVLTGTGRAFSTGDDISELQKFTGLNDYLDLWQNYVTPWFRKLLDLTKPFIVAVNGLAYGGGCEIVMLADMAVASEEATFSNPEMLFGGFAPITIALGPMLFGRKNAIEMIFTNKVLTAQEAFRIGLVNHVVPGDQLREAVTALAKKVMTSAPTALRVVRKLFSKQLEAYMNDLETATRDLVITTESDDFKEGVAAFLEKRKPRWLQES